MILCRSGYHTRDPSGLRWHDTPIGMHDTVITAAGGLVLFALQQLIDWWLREEPLLMQHVL